MDAGRLAELKAWAGRLEERSSSDEMRAAARAILMLVEEVEVLRARLVEAEAAASPAVDEVDEFEPEPDSSGPVRFGTRLKRALLGSR